MCETAERGVRTLGVTDRTGPDDDWESTETL